MTGLLFSLLSMSMVVQYKQCSILQHLLTVLYSGQFRVYSDFSNSTTSELFIVLTLFYYFFHLLPPLRLSCPLFNPLQIRGYTYKSIIYQTFKLNNRQKKIANKIKHLLKTNEKVKSTWIRNRVCILEIIKFTMQSWNIQTLATGRVL